jgi:AcrR family transcriptional regulator
MTIPVRESPVVAGSTGPRSRRSGLQQERSRHTRNQLVRAALTLWTQRGFQHGIEDTTAEEIAQAAGVTKGTFYFHFGHKEDILLELGWGAAEAMLAEAEAAMLRGRPAAKVLDGLASSLARRVDRVPRVAVCRSVAEFYCRSKEGRSRSDGHFGFRRSFTAVVEYGKARGEFPPAVDAANLGGVLEAVSMEALMQWAEHGKGSLQTTLRRYIALVVAGASDVFAPQSRSRSRTPKRTR